MGRGDLAKDGAQARPRAPPLAGVSLSAFSLGLLVGVGLAMGEGRRGALEAAPDPAAGLRGSRGWRGVLIGSVQAFGRDNISAAAAGVTFYILLALFPALSAFVSLYGLVANVQDAQRQMMALSGFLPSGAMKVLGGEMTRLVSSDHGALGLAFLVSLAVSFWSANAGIKALIGALNMAYEIKERRGFLRLTAVSLAFTVAGIVAAAAGVALLVAAPGVLARLGLGGWIGVAYLRWPILLAAAVALLCLLYRFGPSRHEAAWRWIAPGGVLAAAGWMLMSALFSWYVANFGHYNKTYGSLGAVIGFLTWIWLSLMVVLFGAELNAALERRARADQRKRGAT